MRHSTRTTLAVIAAVFLVCGICASRVDAGIKSMVRKVGRAVGIGGRSPAYETEFSVGQSYPVAVQSNPVGASLFYMTEAEFFRPSGGQWQAIASKSALPFGRYYFAATWSNGSCAVTHQLINGQTAMPIVISPPPNPAAWTDASGIVHRQIGTNVWGTFRGGVWEGTYPKKP